ncbi:MAG TPA: PP2C family protein-serine/threonine phosphatase [Candidatus Dormibacteraeota bacterium]|nr:PP2C family protein-serine/threonine phosphatase [Candidatus Dormibacteraeota bacterium]
MVKDSLRCPDPECGESVLPEDRFCEACGLELALGWADPPIEVLTPEAAPPELAPPELAPPEFAPPELLPGGLVAPQFVLPAAVGPDDRSHIEMSLPDMAGVSDIGLRHQCNEDAMGLAKIGPPSVRVLVVCDGVSTSSEPAAAAQAAADAALAYLMQAVQNPHLDPESAMTQAVGAAQRAVSAVEFSADQADEPPATTLVAALVMDHQTTIGWVGDSRAYLVGPDDAWQLSQDHTWATEQVEMGMLPDDAIFADPRAHALTKWLGGDIEGGFEPSVATFAVPVSGCLVLCTDGLWNYAPSPERMCGLVAQLPGDATPLEVAQGLTEFARSAGGSDNITVAVAFV